MAVLVWCLMVQGWDEIAPTCVQYDIPYAECLSILEDPRTYWGSYSDHRTFCETVPIRVFPINNAATSS